MVVRRLGACVYTQNNLQSDVKLRVMSMCRNKCVTICGLLTGRVERANLDNGAMTKPQSAMRLRVGL